MTATTTRNLSTSTAYREVLDLWAEQIKEQAAEIYRYRTAIGGHDPDWATLYDLVVAALANLRHDGYANEFVLAALNEALDRLTEVTP